MRACVNLHFQHDRVFCDEDGLICNQQNVANAEAPYYSPQARLQVLIAADTDMTSSFTKPRPKRGANPRVAYRRGSGPLGLGARSLEMIHRGLQDSRVTM